MYGRKSGLACGQVLSEARRRRGLSQRDLAKRAGTTQAAISRIERDQVSPSISTLNRVLEAMGETLLLQSASLDAPPPGGGNSSIRELRAMYEDLTPEERISRAIKLSRTATALAASQPRAEESSQ